MSVPSNVLEHEVERLLREGRAAAKRGDKAVARALLTKAVEQDSNNESAWLWLSGVVEDPEEQQICLENVLVLNPSNDQARRGLEYISARTGVAPRLPAAPSNAPLEALEETGPLGQDGKHAPLTGAQNALFPSEGALENPNGDLPPWMTPEPGTPKQAPVRSTNGSQGDGSPAAPPFQTATTEPWAISADPSLGTRATSAPSTEVAAQSGPPVDSAHQADLLFLESLKKLTGEGEDDVAALPEIEPFVPPSLRGAGSADAGAQSGRSIYAAQEGATQDELPGWLENSGSGGVNGRAAAGDGPAPDGAQPAPSHVGSPEEGVGPVGPYSASLLPSPDQLPGASKGAGDEAQPWYLRPSGGAGVVPTAPPAPGAPPDGINPSDLTQDSMRGMGGASGKPRAMIACPNCKEQSPDTAMVCPKCAYSFFVNCPHCHELIDVSEVKTPGPEPCPYCGVTIDKFELGKSETKGLVSVKPGTPGSQLGPLSDYPQMQQINYEMPEVRKGIGFGWVVDLLWLFAVVAMVWALTQLPTWLHLTGQY